MSTRTRTTWLVWALVAVLALSGLVTQVSLVSAASVEAEVIPGNPSCVDRGYDFGFKPQPEPPPSGIYTYPNDINTVNISSDGTYFDWTSTLGVDAVIVKGGPNANLYAYEPPAESYGDTGLHSPINPNNGQPYAISHIEFCYDYEVDVSKTAETSFTRTFAWTIDKSVTPDSWDLFTGDSGTSEYTVAVTKDEGTDSDWAVKGTITIENKTPFVATIDDVSDAVSGYGAIAVDCGVDFPYVLSAGQQLICSYGPYDLLDGTSRINTATVETSGDVGGGEAKADVVFGTPTDLVNDEISVVDTNGESWGPVSDDATWTYERTFTCDDAGTNDNTATIVKTGQSNNASVTVNCYALEVTKDASTTFNRYWEWTIDKSADQEELTLSIGQQFTVNYQVAVDAASYDNYWAVSGEISISNPHPDRAAVLTAVSDLVSPDILATVICPAFSVPADGTLICSYSADLTDAAQRSNTATATLQNYDFASDGTATEASTTDFISDPVDVVFNGNPTEEFDECIDVSDTFAAFLGTVCAADAPTTFSYSRWVGPYDVCGTYTVKNTASFVTNDTLTTGSDEWTVNVDVPCQGGCTLTQGYWKTHSEYGPAPYDDTWALLPDGADTPFFLSGQTYYEVLWTPPAGNVYYILAHQYIAAELNFLNGADPTAAQDAFDQATELFELHTPAWVYENVKGKDKKEWTDLASILDDYNNGDIGPGHCSEELVAAEKADTVLDENWIYLPTVSRN